MDVLDRRRILIQQNERVASLRIAELQECDEVERAAGRWAELALRCECGAASCEELVHIKLPEFEHVHVPPELGYFMCGPDHVESRIEYISSGHATDDYVVACPRPGWNAPVDLASAQIELTRWQKRVEQESSELNAALTRAATATATAALILGLFGTLFARSLNGNASVWTLFALLPFLMLVGASLYGTKSVRTELRKALNPMDFATLDELRGMISDDSPVHQAEESMKNVPGITYEVLQRYDEARRANPLMPLAMLPSTERVLFELQDQVRLHGLYLHAQKRTDRLESDTLFWLTVLVIYIVVVGVFA